MPAPHTIPASGSQGQGRSALAERLRVAAKIVGRRQWHVGTAGLATGLALSPTSPELAIAVALPVLLWVALTGAPAVGLLAAAAVLGGFALGDARLETADRAAARAAQGTRIEARAFLLERPRASQYESRALIEVRSGPARGVRLLARGPRTVRWPREADPGTEVVVAGNAAKPRADAAADFDYPAYLRRRGIPAELMLEEIRATGRRRGGALGAIDGLRRRAERAIDSGLSRSAAALMRGMVLGEDEAIWEPVRDDFRRSGLAHLLAVSGHNVMLLGALAVPLLAAAGAGPATRIAVVAALIAVYVPLGGAGPSLQRAGVMGIAGLAAVALARPASRSYVLLLAAAVTLAINPRAAGDPGWQLSFAAVAGILLMAPALRRALRGLGRWLADSVAITIAATLATTPLLAHHFGSVPLASLPANLAALPVVAPIMWIGMLQTGLAQVATPAAEALGVAAGPLLAYLAELAARFAELPGSELRVSLRSPRALLVAYCALAGGALLLARAGRRLEPGVTSNAAAWRRLPRGRRYGIVVALVTASALGTARWLSGPDPPERPRVSFLDVGQGDATLVQHPDGSAVLFDGGPPEGRVSRLLRRAGVKRLSAVVATHASRDHHGGLRQVIQDYPVDVLLDGGDGTGDRSFRALLVAAERRGVRRVRATAPLRVRAGGLAIDVLSPSSRPPGPPPEDPNPRAVVAVVSAGAFDLFLSADAESPALESLELPDVEAMKVPHHGSSDPGLAQVLGRLSPEIAAIEVGENSYGHPAPSTLAALRAAGITTYRTDRDGTVRLISDAGTIDAATER